MPDVFVLDRSFGRVAGFYQDGAVSRSTSARVIEAEILAKVRALATSAVPIDASVHVQFVSNGKFVRVLALDAGAGLIVMVEAMHNHSGIDNAEAKYGLSAREYQVLKLVVRATSRANIARLLEISETTVQSHIRNIGFKMGCTRREEMISRVLGAFDDERESA